MMRVGESSFRVIRCTACVAVLGAILAGSRAQADDLTTKDGKIYKDYHVQKTDKDGITLEYTETVVIPFDNLPDDIQRKYGHDPNVLSAEQAAEKARVEAENREAAQIEAGFDEHHVKPLDLDRIDEAIRRLSGVAGPPARTSMVEPV